MLRQAKRVARAEVTQPGDGADVARVDVVELVAAVAVSVTKDYPGVVMILIPGGGLCTGTFISPRAVLTAAHCTPRAGSYSVLSSFGSFVTSHYEKFGEGVVEDPNDIAILMFDKNYANAEEGQIHPIGTSVRAGETVQIVGYGCNDLSARTGSGKKRKGTNQIETVNDYIELASPDSIPSMHSDSRGILGPSNRAGSCFGDSGGPMFQTQKGNIAIVGATHAGGTDGNTIVSQYIDLNRADNLDFIHRVDSRHSLQVFDTCIMKDRKSVV